MDGEEHDIATLVVGLTVASVLLPPRSLCGASAVTPRDIDNAIDWGLQHDPTPYLLHHAGPDGGISSAIVDVVYTPFLRVALAAKQAQLQGRRFGRDDVTTDMVQPVIYVAFQWY